MARWAQVTEWLKGTDPHLGAEIGVKEGRFISYLLNQYPDLIMYAIDPWEDQPSGNETYIEWDWSDIYSQYQQKIQPYNGRVLELRAYSEQAAEKVEDYSLDFVFIDAQHDYDSVRQDIELWMPKIKVGGLLSGHDYQPNFPGVIQAVHETVGDPLLGSNDTWAVRI